MSLISGELAKLSTSRGNPPRIRRQWLLVLFACHAISDLFLVNERPGWHGFWLGIWASQFMLLAMWAIAGPRWIVWQLPRMLVLAAFVWQLALISVKLRQVRLTTADA